MFCVPEKEEAEATEEVEGELSEEEEGRCVCVSGWRLELRVREVSNQ